MREFTKKQATFYTGRTGRQIRQLKSRALAKDVMLVADYLFSGPLANPFGLYQLEPEVVVVHLPVSLAELKAALAVLADLGFAYFDEDTRWVWVVEMAGRQLGAPLKSQDNVVRSIKRWYAGLSKGCPYAGMFYDHYEESLCLGSPGERSGPAVPRRGSEGASKPPSQSQSHSQVLDLAGEGGLGGEPSAPAELELVAPGPRPVPPPAAPTWREATFGEFWEIYPKPSGRKEALQEWLVHVTSEPMAREVIARLRALLPTFNYENQGKYILDPCRWIKRHRWQDEPPAIPNMNARSMQTARTIAAAAARRGAPR